MLVFGIVLKTHLLRHASDSYTWGYVQCLYTNKWSCNRAQNAKYAKSKSVTPTGTDNGTSQTDTSDFGCMCCS